MRRYEPIVLGVNMSEWINVGKLDESDCDFSDYTKKIGVYKAQLDGKIVYIGKATEIKNGGFRKRLRDYNRESNSARNYTAGLKLYDNRTQIEISIMPVATAAEAAALEKRLIKELKPEWNSLA